MNPSKNRTRRLILRWLPHALAAVALGAILIWDRAAYEAIRDFRSPFLDWLVDRVAQLRGATFPAAVGLLLIAGGFYSGRRKLRRAGAAVILTVLLAGVLSMVMKEIIARPGPEVDDVSGLSWIDARYGRFPSSHAAITFGAALTLGAFAPATILPGVTLAALVCHERIYRGAHFPSDVFAGVWIGIVVSRFVMGRIHRSKWGEDLLPAAAKTTRPAVAYEWPERAAGETGQETAD